MKLSYDEKDFYLFAARLANANNAQVVKWWDVFYEVIIRQLYLSGSVYLPGIGWLTLKHKESTRYTRQNSNGEIETVVLPERNEPVFRADDDFINDANMLGVTRNYRKRQRNGTLTARDKERERRGREIMGDNFYALISEQKDLRETAIANFDNTLKVMRQNYEAELDSHMRGTDGKTKQ